MDPPVPAGVPFPILFPLKNCHACGKRTTEIYQRTFDGKGYCIDCLNKGAGIEDYYEAGLERFVSDELRELAKANGFAH